MIKICFVTTISGTIKAFLLEYAKYLVEKKGFDVTFICSEDKSLESLLLPNMHFIPVHMKRGIGTDGLSVIKQLTRIFKKEKFDIVQYSTPNAALYASIASKLAKINIRLYCQWGIRYMGLSGISRSLMKIIEKITCNCSTVIECESHSLLNFSVKEGLYLPEKSSVIWNGSACGVNLEKFDISRRKEWRDDTRTNLNIDNKDVVFGYTGRITKDKGINELLHAFKRIEKEKTNAKLLLVGDLDNEKTIDVDLWNWAEQSQSVIHIPFTKDVNKYYSAMDVFASLSYREGFGLVVIEAAAMGVPSIVTNVPGQIDTIEEKITGISVKDHDVDSVIKAIQFYISNKNNDEMGRQARLMVETKYEQKKLFEMLAKHKIELIEK